MNKILFPLLLSLLFGTSCAPRSASLSTLPEVAKNPIPAGANESGKALPTQSVNFSDTEANFAFSLPLPDSSWTATPRATDSRSLEFQRREGNIRADITWFLRKKGETLQLEQRALSQLDSRNTRSDTTYRRSYARWNLEPLDGFLWQFEGRTEGIPTQACGFTGHYNGTFYEISMSRQGEGSVRKLLTIFKNFVQGFRILQTGKLAPPLPDLETDLDGWTYPAAGLNFHWEGKGRWHEWIDFRLRDDAILLAGVHSNKKTFFEVRTARLPTDEVRTRDLFDVFLANAGILKESLNIRKHRDGAREYRFFSGKIIGKSRDSLVAGKMIREGDLSIFLLSWRAENAVNSPTPTDLIDSFQLDASSIKTRDEKSGEEEKRYSARLLNSVGYLKLSAKQSLVALGFFEKASRLDPKEELYLLNCGFVYQLKKMYGPGIAHFRSRMELVRQHWRLLAILGELHEARQDFGSALTYYEMARDTRPDDEELAINHSDALWGVGQKSMSLEVVQKLYHRQPTLRLGIYMAKTLMGMELYAEAEDLLNELRANFDFNAELGQVLVDDLFLMEQWDRALEVNAQIEVVDGASAQTWANRGRAEFELRQFRSARNSLEKSRALDSSIDGVDQYLAVVKVFLGEGSNVGLRKKIKPALPPLKISKTLLKKQKGKSDASARVLEQRESLRFRKGQTWIRTEELFVEILDEGGVSLFREFTFEFEPGLDRIYVNRLVVFDSTLRVRATGEISRYYVTEARKYTSGSGTKLAHIVVPDLRPGDWIHLQVSRTSLSKTDEIPFVQHKSSRAIPVQNDAFYVFADSSEYLFEEYGANRSESISGGRVWKSINPVVIRKEPYRPPYREFGTGVLISPNRSWNEVGNAYRRLIRHQFKKSIGVREKAVEIKGSLFAPRKIRDAVVRWVRENVRYEALEFGGHSLVPLPSIRTLNQRYGDCKDQALLLKELLENLGIPANLALVHLEENPSLAMPAIEQFNHMIVQIPAGKNYGEGWFDPTDLGGSSRPVPLDLEGHSALVVANDSSWITVLPILEQGQEHRAEFHHRLVVSVDGMAEFRDSVFLEGKFAAHFRDYLLGQGKSRQLALVSDFLETSIPGVTVTSLKTKNMDDFNQALILISTYSVPGFFGRSRLGLVGRFPNVWERAFLRLPNVSHRFHPLKIPHETRYVSTLDLQAPEDWKLEVDSEVGSIVGDYVKRKVTLKKTESTAKVRSEWTAYALYADASEYGDIRREWQEALRASSPLMSLRKP